MTATTRKARRAKAQQAAIVRGEPVTDARDDRGRPVKVGSRVYARPRLAESMLGQWRRSDGGFPVPGFSGRVLDVYRHASGRVYVLVRESGSKAMRTADLEYVRVQYGLSTGERLARHPVYGDDAE